jgi:hypothetical protein
MKWMRERDSLIAQTMAFVQTVGGRKEDAAPRAGIEPAKLEPARPEPARLEPARLEPARLEPARLEPARLEPARLEPGRLEPVKLEPAKLEPVKPEIEVAAFDAVRKALDITPPPREVLGNTPHNPLHNPPPKTVQAARPIVPSEFQNEIRSRIASFRAHQERFNRERAEYFNATLARLRASLDEVAAGRSEK